MNFTRNPSVLALTLLMVKAAHAMDFPVICMSAPVVPLYPGLAVTASLDSQGKRCEALLTFSNPDFFPVQFEFEPNNCLGSQEAEFIVPVEVPNGDAFILWRCANQMSPTCTKAMITGGSEDANAIDFSQTGTLSCVFPISTQTTLSTVTGSSTTFVESITSIILSTAVDGPGSSMTNMLSYETTLISSTVTEPSTTFTKVSTSTISNLATIPSSPTYMSPTGLLAGSPVVETIVSTRVDGTHTMVTTFTSTASTMPSSIVTLIITEPCSA